MIFVIIQKKKNKNKNKLPQIHKSFAFDACSTIFKYARHTVAWIFVFCKVLFATQKTYPFKQHLLTLSHIGFASQNTNGQSWQNLAIKIVLIKIHTNPLVHILFRLLFIPQKSRDSQSCDLVYFLRRFWMTDKMRCNVCGWLLKKTRKYLVNCEDFIYHVVFVW